MKDPSLFIKKTKKKYDIIIVDLPGPVNAGLNRFYTVEFAQSLKKVISINGFVCLKMPSTYNYISKTVSVTQSIVFNSLKTVFDNVKIVPGEFNYFIASDENIRLDFTNLIQLKNINNDYVNEYYLDDYLILARSDYINSNLDSSAPVNQDFKPIAYFNSVLHRLSYFRFNYKIIVIIFCLLLIALFIILKPVSLGLFTVGFTATSLEYIILFTFQVIYGYVFQMIGIIVMIFMAGLAVGSYYGNKIIKTNVFKSFVNYQSILGLLSFVLVIVFVFLKEFALRPIIIHIIFICLTLSFSVITGLLFSVSTKIRINSIIDTAAKRYSVDLLGSAIGILLTSILLVPLIGIIYSLIFLAILNLLVAQIIKFRGMRNFS